MADFPGAPLYGTAAWPFVTPVGAPEPTVTEPIDTIPGRAALAFVTPPPTPPPDPPIRLVGEFGPGWQYED